MKTIKANLRNIALLTIAIGSLALAGCNRSDDENNPNNDPTGRGQVTLTSGQVNTNDFDATPRTRADGTVQKEEISYNIAEEQGFIIDARRGNAEENTPQTRTVVNLAEGVRYQVVIYKEEDYATKKIYKQATFAVGNPMPATEIKLERGNYKLYAYSINSTTANPSITTEGKITVKHGEDFMDTDTQTPLTLIITSEQANNEEQVKLPTLTFQRRCCNIWVKVEAVAYTNTAISACTVSLNNLPKQATWTVGGTTFAQAGATTVSVKVIDNQSSPANTPLRKSAICLPVGDRELTMDYYFKTNAGGTGGEKTFSKTAQSLTSTNFTSGNQYLFTMSGINALVPTMPSATIGGKTWAPCNQSSPGNGRVTNPWDYGYYYTFADAKTACPDGKQPTETDLRLLPKKVAPINTKVYINKTLYTVTDRFGYIGAKGDRNSSSIFMDGNSVLCLPAAGFRRNSSGADGMDMDYVTTYCLYWSCTPADSKGYCLYSTSGSSFVTYDHAYNAFSVRCLQ